MKYWIHLRNPEFQYGGDYLLTFRGETPPHIRQELIDHTHDRFVEEKLRLCKDCSGAHCHVIDEEGWKYCPILFSDLIGGYWNARDLESATGPQDSPWAREQFKLIG